MISYYLRNIMAHSTTHFNHFVIKSLFLQAALRSTLYNFRAIYQYKEISTCLSMHCQLTEDHLLHIIRKTGDKPVSLNED